MNLSYTVMKKILLVPILFFVAVLFQNCGEDTVTLHADGHIHGTVEYHHLVGGVEMHDEIAGATVEMWFNKSSSQGAADFTTLSDALGAFEFEELEGGVYFIHASGMDQDNINREGSILVSIDESNHEVEVEIEVE